MVVGCYSSDRRSRTNSSLPEILGVGLGGVVLASTGRSLTIGIGAARVIAEGGVSFFSSAGKVGI